MDNDIAQMVPVHPAQRVDNVILLQGHTACVPCLLEGCDRHIDSYSDCLQQLPSHRVIAAAATLLDRHSPPGRAVHAV